MRIFASTFTFACLLALFAYGATGPDRTRLPATTPAPSTKPADPWNAYRLIITRNIFSRDRTGAAPVRLPRFSFTRPATTVSTEPELVLTGVVVQDDLRVAFFEESQSGQIHRVAAGKPLGNGIVVQVWLNGVEYRQGQASRKIAIGENLAGQPGSLRVLAASSQPSSMPATGAPAGSGIANQPGSPTENTFNNILERMRQRRQQEDRR